MSGLCLNQKVDIDPIYTQVKRLIMIGFIPVPASILPESDGHFFFFFWSLPPAEEAVGVFQAALTG